MELQSLMVKVQIELKEKSFLMLIILNTKKGYAKVFTFVFPTNASKNNGVFCWHVFAFSKSEKIKYRKNSYAHIKEQVKSSLIYFSSTCEVIVTCILAIKYWQIFLLLNIAMTKEV